MLFFRALLCIFRKTFLKTYDFETDVRINLLEHIQSMWYILFKRILLKWF